ncbi:MAG: multidrug transporter [Lachnospiraceae bacterium]|nr:multidrug transporter [Lachnospiraceae bacterium]
MYEVSKKDWKLYREKIPDWQEAYMERLNKEYVELLTNGEGHASDRFWALDERMKEDKRKPGVQIRVAKSEMLFQIALLLQDEAITMEDLNDFSQDIRDAVNMILNRML